MDRRGFLKSAIQVAAIPALQNAFVGYSTAWAQGPRYIWNGMLELPTGFSCVEIARAGSRMSDGFRLPGRPDGMACFDIDGQWVLMCNHEIDLGDRKIGPLFPGQQATSAFFNPRGMGGVSRIVIDPTSLEVVRTNLALAGTARNCAGGVSPWGWLSCEETVDTGHGYVFCVDPHQTDLAAPRVIPAYGRMNHEAAVVDPETMIAYLTEDRDDGCFYRFLPDSPKTPFEGCLQALKLQGEPRMATASRMRRGQRVEVEWVTIDRPLATDDSLRKQAQAKGAALIRRGEGLWLHEGQVYFAATTGGPIGMGQIFKLSPESDEGTLTVLAESVDRYYFKKPDNLTVTPWGDVWAVEDNGEVNCIRLIKANGDVVYFGKNVASRSELTGVCFSPDGSTMFVNVQEEGVTLAIRGDFLEFR